MQSRCQVKIVTLYTQFADISPLELDATTIKSTTSTNSLQPTLQLGLQQMFSDIQNGIASNGGFVGPAPS